jgi:hypothetical protein
MLHQPVQHLRHHRNKVPALEASTYTQEQTCVPSFAPRQSNPKTAVKRPLGPKNIQEAHVCYHMCVPHGRPVSVSVSNRCESARSAAHVLRHTIEAHIKCQAALTSLPFRSHSALLLRWPVLRQ